MAKIAGTLCAIAMLVGATNATGQTQPSAAEDAAILKQQAKTAPEFIARARALWRRHLLPQMIPELDRAVALDPRSQTALAMRTSIHWILGHSELAAADADRVLALAPKDPDGLRIRALAHAKGDPKAALPLFDEALLVLPRDASLFAVRAELHSQIGDFPRALDDANAAILLNPADSFAYRVKSQILLGQRKIPEVQQLGDDLLRASPHDDVAALTAGDIYCSSEANPRGIAAYQQSLNIRPTAIAFLNRSYCRPQADYSGRQSDLKAALALDPRLKAAWSQLARVQDGLGDQAGAVASLEKASQLFPEDRNVMVDLAAANARNRRPDIARVMWEKARKAATGNADALNSLCYSEASVPLDLEQALVDCQAAIRLAPRDAAILDSLAFVFLRMGRFDEALKSYDEALAIAPKLGMSLYGRGITRLRKGLGDEGRKDLETAKSLYPEIEEEIAFLRVNIEGPKLP